MLYVSSTLRKVLLLTKCHAAATHAVHLTVLSDSGGIIIIGDGAHTSNPSREIKRGHGGGRFGTASGGIELDGVDDNKRGC